MILLFLVAFLLVIFLIGLYILKFSKLSSEIRRNESRSFVTNLVSILLIIIFNLIYLRTLIQIDEVKMYFITNLILICAFLIFSVKNLDSYFHNEIVFNDLKINKYYNNLLVEFTDELRRVRHSYNNILMVISGFVTMKKWDRLEAYLNDMGEDFSKVKKYSPLMFGNLQNVALLILFIDKIKIAEKRGIDLTVDLKVLISEINAKMYVLCGVLGNVLDNEINNSEIHSNRGVLPVKIFEQSNNLVFQIETDMGEFYCDKFKEVIKNEGWLNCNINERDNRAINIIVKDWMGFKSNKLARGGYNG